MKLLKSKSGFTLIELLVVIGILAVLAAIAIPSVAGLIDRANVSADKTNANEMTNAIERFAAEYELYCQDIASGVITVDTTDFDAAQGRVYNVTHVKTRAGISDFEVAQNAEVEDDVLAIYRDTKYPVNAKTLRAIVENYTKTSSATFEPKQSDMHYWYSPDCGVVVFAKPDADIVADLNSQIQSGTDAKGNQLGPQTQWVNLTTNSPQSDNSVNIPTVNTDLSTNTWADVQKISQEGKVAEAGWNIGDTKELQINGSTATATLIGINHDGTNSTTWMVMSSGGVGKSTMNTTQTNAGGWQASNMRKWLNDTVYESMTDTKEHIKTVNKYTNNTGNGNDTVSATSDKLFLLSPNECGFTNYDANATYNNSFYQEGTTYAWFVNGNILSEDSWLRSACFLNNIGFTYYSGGTGNFGTFSVASNKKVVYPAFVIG